jgi:glycerol-3-phosphate acyltransferase PlsY
MLPQLLWLLLSFFAGALPLSVWVGRLAARRDIREVADHNPGATNVLRVAGPGWFVLAMVLDISKAAAPVGLAYHIFGWRGWPMILIALAPPLGHAFSPFLGGKGGKAIAPVFGAMIGLTIWTTPLVAVASVVIYMRLLRPNGWAVILALLTVLGYLLALRPDPLLIAVTAGQLALLAYTHRADLAHHPVWRLSRQKEG